VTALLAATALVASPSAVGAPGQHSVPVYTIGFEGPLSGPLSSYGTPEINAARLAIAQANTSGRYPFRLRLRTVDDQGDPAQSPAAAEELINDPHVLGVVGPSFSGSTQATGDFYAQAGLGFVTPSATNPSLSRNGWSVFHRIEPSDTAEARQVADWLARRGVQRLYVLYDESPYGHEIGKAVTDRAHAQHMHVVEARTAASAHTKWRAIAHRIGRSGAHALFYGGYDAQAAQLAKALDHEGYNHLRASGNGVFSSVFTNQAGAAGSGWYVSCGCMTAYRTTASHAFARAYQHMFGHAPGEYSGAAYDAANAVIRALGNAVAHGRHSRHAINAALGRLDFAGISTRVRFTADGDIAASAARVNLFQDRSRRFVQLGNIRREH
jgi:branched-chain amino acid transport system substrate-binding protein